MAIFWDSIWTLSIMIAVNGWLMGFSEIYKEKKEDMILYFREFNKCQAFIYNLKNLFVRGFIPFYYIKIRGQRIVGNCLWPSLCLLLVMASVKAYEVIKNQKK